jgi:Domain of unknown function (DUF5664)
MPTQTLTRKSPSAKVQPTMSDENPWANGAKPSNPKDAVSYKKIPLSSVTPTSALVGIALGMIDGGLTRHYRKDDTKESRLGRNQYHRVPLLSIVPISAVVGIALGMEEGALKYSRHNYRIVGVRASVYYDAATRHLAAFWNGQDLDPDSKVGLHHLDKALASIAVLRDSIWRGNWVDDRPPAMGGNWLEIANSITLLASGREVEPGDNRASDLMDEADRQMKSFWEGCDIAPGSRLSLHPLDKAAAAIAVLRESIFRNDWLDDRPEPLDPKWIDEANTKAASLVATYPNPPAPCTQVLIDEAKAAGADVTIPTGRKE